MKSLVFKITSILAMALFCLMPMANAAKGGSVKGDATCYSSYDGCALSNCISRLICDGNGTCSRTQVGTVSEKGTC